MIFLTKPVKAQVQGLSERVAGYTRSMLRLSYAVAVTAVVALCCFGLANFEFTMGISEVNIPSSLLVDGAKTNDKLWSGLGFAEWVWWGIRHLWVLVIPYVFLITMQEIKWKIKALDDVKEIIFAIGATALISVVVYIVPAGIDYVSGDFSPRQKLNSSLVREIIKSGDKGPISPDYISSVVGLAERYTLAQVAIISEADFPVSFFKKLSDDLQGVSDFSPSEDALFVIETAANGHPVTPWVVERANEVSRYHTIASWMGTTAVGVTLLLMSWGLGLAVIRRSIVSRLASIEALVKGD